MSIVRGIAKAGVNQNLDAFTVFNNITFNTYNDLVDELWGMFCETVKARVLPLVKTV